MVLISIKLYEDAMPPKEVLGIQETGNKRIENINKGYENEGYKALPFMNPVVDRKIGCLFGIAVGDALGASVEFHPRSKFEPVTDMRSGGGFNLEAACGQTIQQWPCVLVKVLLIKGVRSKRPDGEVSGVV